MSLHYGQFCPISKAAEVLGERWTILIIRELLVGTTRYSDFQRALSKISPTLLTKRLNELVDCGLVVRQFDSASPFATSATERQKRTRPKPSGQPRATYHLTPAGEELKPLVFGLGEWGAKWARGQMRNDELDVELLMMDFCRRIDPTKLPADRAVIGFAFPRLPKFAHWWIVFQPDRDRELCVENPRKHVDLQIRTNVRTLVEIWTGDTDLRAAAKDGRLQLSGDPALIRTLASWLRPGLSAHIRPSPRALRV
jgi:DNA-binding HxlR family transcriptional regulator